MLVGVIAFNVLKVVPATETRAVGVLLVGYVFQGNQAPSRSKNAFCLTLGYTGLGFFMTFFYICIYIIR